MAVFRMQVFSFVFSPLPFTTLIYSRDKVPGHNKKSAGVVLAQASSFRFSRYRLHRIIYLAFS